jgi:hypothetical protein
MFGVSIVGLATGFGRLSLSLFLVAPPADALQVGQPVVIAAPDVVDLDGGRPAADPADGVAEQNGPTKARPARWQFLPAGAAFPRLLLVDGARLQVGAACAGADLRRSGRQGTSIPSCANSSRSTARTSAIVIPGGNK